MRRVFFKIGEDIKRDSLHMIVVDMNKLLSAFNSITKETDNKINKIRYFNVQLQQNE